MTRSGLLVLLTVLPAAAAPLPELERERLAVLEKWGSWTVTDGTCSYQLGGDRIRIRLSDQAHTFRARDLLAPDTPCFLRSVDGDFTAVVRVTAPPRHEPDAGRDRWVAGGLIVQDGRKLYIIRRVEGRYSRSEPIVLTQANDGRGGEGVRAFYLDPRCGPTFLRLTRRGDRVTSEWGPDGTAWTETHEEVSGWNPRVRVGIVAENCLGEPAEVTFDRYSLAQPKK